jgi:AraC-like DNA-binding protein
LFQQAADERLLSLLRVLQLLARDHQTQALASPNLVPDLNTADRARIDKILDYIHRHYAAGLTVTDLAQIAALSPSGLHRLFWRHTQMTISDYVMRLKIGEACALLSATSKPIHYIADATGYRSLANFNRQFKRLKGVTPRAYRQHFQTN